MFCALIKTKSAHAKLQSIKNAWSKDEIWCLEMAALLAQGNSESDKYRFNTTFLTGSDYYRYTKLAVAEKICLKCKMMASLHIFCFDIRKYACNKEMHKSTHNFVF